ncbi:MAG: hypothetical protein U9R34_08425 [Nanoarchaeota archaeon]|nr:hypothetical protein [Nanoarchaeota archaeon]
MAKKVLYIIARAGGWDGCAMQGEIWIEILVKNKYNISLLTGMFEEESDNFFPYNKINIIKNGDLSLESEANLYHNGFEDKYDRKPWIKAFLKNKGEIKNEIAEYFKSHDIIILHNISLRYLIPSLWAALYELSVEYPEKKIISIEPDSPYERRYLLNKYSSEVLYMLNHPSTWYNKNNRAICSTLNNINKRSLKMLPGPIHRENTYHVVLNAYQYNAHRDIFGIPESNLVKIPDIGRFNKKQTKYSEQELLDYFLENQIMCPKKAIMPEDLFFISPVRPVYRKNIKYLIKVMAQFRIYLYDKKGLSPNLFMIITHINKDDKDYFWSLVELAEELDITIIYLGDSLKLRRLRRRNVKIYDEVLEMLSNRKSICFSASAFGGWENAVVECSEKHIPVFVNPKIPVFGDMVRMGYIYHIIPFINMPNIKDFPSTKLWESNYSFELFLENIYSFFYDMSLRKKITDHNYNIGLKYQAMKYLESDLIIPLLRKNH